MHSMSTSAVLNAALGGLARSWRRLIWPAVVGSVPAAAGAFALFNMTDAGALVRVAVNTPEGFRTLPSELRTQMVTDFSLGSAVALALQLLGVVFIFVATHIVVAEDEGPGGADDGAPSRRLLARVWSVYPLTIASATLAMLGSAAAIGLGLVVWSIPFTAVGLPNGLAAGVAILTLIIMMLPGLWLLSSVSTTTAISALEQKSIIASIQESAALVKGRVGSTLAYLLIIGSLAGPAIILIQVVAIPLAATSEPTVFSIVGIGAAVVGQGMLTAAIGVMISYWYLALGQMVSRR